MKPSYCYLVLEYSVLIIRRDSRSACCTTGKKIYGRMEPSEVLSPTFLLSVIWWHWKSTTDWFPLWKQKRVIATHVNWRWTITCLFFRICLTRWCCAFFLFSFSFIQIHVEMCGITWNSCGKFRLKLVLSSPRGLCRSCRRKSTGWRVRITFFYHFYCHFKIRVGSTTLYYVLAIILGIGGCAKCNRWRYHGAMMAFNYARNCNILDSCLRRLEFQLAIRL